MNLLCFFNFIFRKLHFIVKAVFLFQKCIFILKLYFYFKIVFLF